MSVLALLLGGCSGDPTVDGLGTDTTDATDAPPPDTGDYPWPIWLYQSTLTSGTAALVASDGVQAVRIDGFLWSSMFGGPTLVAEPDHEIRYTVTNLSPVELALTWPGVEVVSAAPVPASGEGTEVLRTTLGPGVWVAAATDPALARRGAFSLVTVRDPELFPVEDLDFQLNLLMLDPPAEHTEVDACRFDGGTFPACPAWRPAAAGEATALVTQRLILNQAPVRHGSAPNEFLTLTVRSLEIPAGADVRINLASLADGPHTITLGGLSATDPSGAVVTEVALEPGATASLLLRALGPAGAYTLGCADHDHHGLGEVALTVSE